MPVDVRTPILAALLIAGVCGAGAVAADQSRSAANPAGLDKGQLPPSYLKASDLPDSLALLPPPPVAGSAAMRRDEAARASVLKLRGTSRYRLAAADAVIGPDLPDYFSCSAGIAISKQATPHLYGLMAKMMIDVGLSTYRAKDHYNRVRPFVVHKAHTCYAKDEAMLRHDGSYPSGHSAIGWGYALVLAELIPARADAILQRGRDFGHSRLVCDAHWQSDIDAGRVIASAAVARLHADPAFRSDLNAARAEVSGETGKGVAAEPKCAGEAAALAATR